MDDIKWTFKDWAALWKLRGCHRAMNHGALQGDPSGVLYSLEWAVKVPWYGTVLWGEAILKFFTLYIFHIGARKGQIGNAPIVPSGHFEYAARPLRLVLKKWFTQDLHSVFSKLLWLCTLWWLWLKLPWTSARSWARFDSDAPDSGHRNYYPAAMNPGV